jgi:hypothetical protein
MAGGRSSAYSECVDEYVGLIRIMIGYLFSGFFGRIFGRFLICRRRALLARDHSLHSGSAGAHRVADFLRSSLALGSLKSTKLRSSAPRRWVSSHRRFDLIDKHASCETAHVCAMNQMMMRRLMTREAAWAVKTDHFEYVKKVSHVKGSVTAQ